AYPGSSDAHFLNATDLERVPAATYEVFEPMWPPGPISIYAAHSEIHFYTWGDCRCCLDKGATAATLIDDGRALKLRAGDVLIFEEVIGPRTGNPADADPTHRQAVRLVRVMPIEDPLFHPQGSDGGLPLVEIEWAPQDALRFPLCLSAQAPP